MAKKIDLNGLDHFKEKENAMIASEYSSSKTYAVGDYVYHNGTLYKCTTAITTAEAWTSGHWTAAKLADDCSGLMTAVSAIKRNLYNIMDLSAMNVGYRMDNNTGELVADALYVASDYMVCDGLQHIMLIDREGSTNSTTNIDKSQPGGLYWNFYDANKSFIPSGNTNANPATVPNGAKYARVRFAKQNYDAHIDSGRIDGVFGVSSLAELTNWTFYQEPQYTLNGSPYAVDGAKVHPKIISCWGDSLTDGTGDNNTYGYPNRLATLIGSNKVNVNNFGLGGQNSLGISRRLSAMPVYVNPFTIPADTSAVSVTLFDNDGAITSLFNRGGSIADANLYRACINPCIINGVEGTLTQTNSTGGYTFARKASGTAVSVERPALLETWGYRNQRNDVTVIWAGNNDTSSWMSITWTMENIQRMIETLSHDKYIILGLTSKHQFNDIVNRNNAMFRKFGRHFLDVRQYLLDYGLSDNNLTPTEQDLADIADGEIPSSLRTDDMHLKNYGYQSVAKCVYIRGKELGYWS